MPFWNKFIENETLGNKENLKHKCDTDIKHSHAIKNRFMLLVNLCFLHCHLKICFFKHLLLCRRFVCKTQILCLHVV
jgi:hypothetical protein